MLAEDDRAATSESCASVSGDQTAIWLYQCALPRSDKEYRTGIDAVCIIQSMDGPSPFAASDRVIASGRRDTAIAASFAMGKTQRSQDFPGLLRIICLNPIIKPVIQTFLNQAGLPLISRI